MPNQHKKKFLIGTLSILSVAVLASCTSVNENLGYFFTQAGTVIGGNNNNNNAKEKTQLATPGDFTVTDDGKYSFKGVENADAYLLYLCDKTSSEEGSYLYSGQIEKNEANSNYQGAVKDLFSYSYNSYTAKVVAYAKASSSYSTSEAATADYLYKGALSTPVVEYSYAASTGTLTLELYNALDYALEVAPDSIDFTVTDNTDNSKSTTAQLTSINTSTQNNSANYTDVTIEKGHSYTISAKAASASACVTNSVTSAITVMTDTTLDAQDVASPNFVAKQQSQPGGGGGPGGNDFVIAIKTVTFAKGASSFTIPLGTHALLATCLATLKSAPNTGDTYTYTIKSTDANAPFTVTGTLDLVSDQTAKLDIGAAGPITATKKSGTWSDDGTNITVTLA